ncbi:MAG: PilZ domain-containing protein [Candidatus Scalindua sp. AMX11]|nr:MAG: PilZ domain-containing protein [Candidatus Scalindua sp.]NOG84357.1 PilZ domain-containing protein [Planctomycetota bacterium]RZV74438.1 MAG: PilZ domain-containing protein [Candidatus Scalindua sp. SCAELEC01]TDE65359.1 MAG: PilZ domain-containing protein [Candidatus Scalindua sp. AMX11]GJQ60817.1 MAG: hypothetical protein SCALA701_36180 [Candidatus Scalindua sp.]
MNTNFTENRDVKNFLNRIERRSDRRLGHSLQVVLPGHKAMTRDVSPSGAYLEVITECRKHFSVGKMVQLEITASIDKNWFSSKTIKLTGSGEVVRVDEIENLGIVGTSKKVGVALHFIGKLKIINDNYLYDM